ncbi:PucR family transcriptional regulator [Sciscionella sediminilitoris]|uniref:PucR family transcriptional regulator n=1 Tax=Sciscionella sediminilitoris TaxID=1445613 RepID=UPI000A504732|nr:helix-turn-helix domain-containing protein [Sciscionella sp. SE31]
MITLATLVRQLGPGRLRPLTGATDREVAEPVFVYEPGQTPSGGIALLTGPLPGEEAIGELAAAGVGAAIVRAPEAEAEALAARLGAEDIALLLLTGTVGWLELAGQLHAVLAGSPAPEANGGGDLFALADMIAATVGGAVTIEDPHERVLAYSSLAGQPTDQVRRAAILGRQVPDLPYNPNSYERLLQSASVVRFAGAEPDLLPRLAVAVRAEGELLGSLWAIDAHTELGSPAEDALLRAANLTAVHLVRARQAKDAEQRRRTRMLADMLGGAYSPVASAAQLGADPRDTAVVLAFGQDQPAIAGKLAEVVRGYFEVYHRPALCGVVADRAYAVLAEPAAGGELPGLVRRTVASASAALGTTVRAGLGHEAGAWTELPRARRDAERALRAITSRPELGPVASRTEVADLVVLGELAAEPGEVLGEPVPAVAAMLEHDRRYGTHYAQTVRTVLAEGPRGGTAAERLAVHPTTLRYRLRRAEQLFGLRLDDADARLVTWLQLRLR